MKNQAVSNKRQLEPGSRMPNSADGNRESDKVVHATQGSEKCHSPSAYLHSRYVRRLADLPWLGVAVRIAHQGAYCCLFASCRVFLSAVSTIRLRRTVLVIE